MVDNLIEFPLIPRSTVYEPNQATKEAWSYMYYKGRVKTLEDWLIMELKRNMTRNNKLIEAIRGDIITCENYILEYERLNGV